MHKDYKVNTKHTADSAQLERRHLDKEYLELREVICNSEFYRTTSRHNRIRLNLWSRKLDQIILDIAWKRNRNNYIKLMYLMSQTKIIVDPFLALPPENDLPFLRNYEINAAIDLVQSKINEKLVKHGFCNQCLTDDKQRTLPFRLQTTRNSFFEDQASIGERLSLHLPKRNTSKTIQKIKYETKTTSGGQYNDTDENQFGECEEDQKENLKKRVNMTQTKTKETIKKDSFCLKHRDLNSTLSRSSSNIQKINKSDRQQTIYETDLSEHVTVPRISHFHSFAWKHA